MKKFPKNCISSQELGVNQALVSVAATQIIKDLKAAGFEAFIVGGGIRDILLGVIPKDFDVVTDALPEQIQEVFGRQCRLIGRRFRLAHVRYRRELIEVATYRCDTTQFSEPSIIEPMMKVVSDNSYGKDQAEDAFRRDFRINALYYDPVEHVIFDHTGAMEDITHKRLRLIGEPAIRYEQDPARMLRAVRLASKLGLSIEQSSQDFIPHHGHLLKKVATARMFDEILKLFLSGYALKTLEGLITSGLFGHLFKDTWDSWQQRPETQKLVTQVMINTDSRIQIGKPVTPAFFFAALLWYPLLQAQKQLLARKSKRRTATELFQQAKQEVISRQLSVCAIPKRFSQPMAEMWDIQRRLEQRRPNQILRLMAHRRFRAAYDLLLLREEAGELPESKLGQWWTRIQEVDPEQRQQMIKQLPSVSRKKGPKKPAPDTAEPDTGNSGD